MAKKDYVVGSNELYYLACSDHLDWGSVDHPPLSVVLLKLSRLALGDSPFSIRLLSAVTGAVTVFFTGLLARRMGAGRFGQLLASLCVLVAGVYPTVGHTFSVDASTSSSGSRRFT